jgi:hypothetical protein
VTSYVFDRQHCHTVHRLEERDLELVRPEEFRLEYHCANCGLWTLVRVVGAIRELTVEP